MLYPLHRTRSWHAGHHSMRGHASRHRVPGSMSERRPGRQSEARSSKGLVPRRGKVGVSAPGRAANELWSGGAGPPDELRSSRW